MERLNDLLKHAEGQKKKAVIAGAAESHVLLAAKEAYIHEIIEPVLIGKKDDINKVADQISFDISSFSIIEASEEAEIAEKAVCEVSEGRASILIKGLVNTGTILKFVLNKKYNLNSGNILSHVATMEIPGFNKLLLVSDAALNIAPTEEQVMGIVKNAVAVARSLGIETPKVAILSANEKISEKMASTVLADKIKQRVLNGEINNVIIDGPLALDIAVSREALEIKKVTSPVNGEADILIAPNIESGNVLYKALIHFAKAETAGIISGAMKPVVVTSRADSELSKLYSIALASIYKY